MNTRFQYYVLLLIAIVLAMASLVLGLYIFFLNNDVEIILSLFIPVGLAILFFWLAARLRFRIKSRRELEKFLPDMNPIEEKFYESATLKTKSCVLYSPDVAINFITELKVNNMWLLGIDGFFIHELHENHENSILQPSREDSIDFTTEHGTKLTDNPYDYAIRFIKNRLSKNLYYEIVSE